jgi:hypothetical protein
LLCLLSSVIRLQIRTTFGAIIFALKPLNFFDPLLVVIDLEGTRVFVRPARQAVIKSYGILNFQLQHFLSVKRLHSAHRHHVWLLSPSSRRIGKPSA